jgi:hypothetical protein
MFTHILDVKFNISYQYNSPDVATPIPMLRRHIIFHFQLLWISKVLPADFHLANPFLICDCLRQNTKKEQVILTQTMSNHC